MKSKIIIYVCDEIDEPMYTVEGDFQFDTSIIIIVNSKHDLAEVMKNETEIMKKYKDYVDNLEFIREEEEEDGLMDRLKSIDNYEDLMNSVEYVRIYPKKNVELDVYGDFFHVCETENYEEDEEITKFREYLFHQPYLKNKKIVIPETFEPSIIEEVQSIYEGYDILMFPKDSAAPMSLKEIENVSYFFKLCDDIKKLELSPLERILMCYDIVREREYNLGVENDSFESRDIYKILNGDQIVCAGYSDIICRMFKELDIPFMFTRLNDKDFSGGHARVTVFVDDEKYGIKGLFGLDPTFDSKKEEEGNEYLNKYKFFLKDLDFFNQVDDNINLYQSTFGLLKLCELKDFPKYVDRIDGFTMDDKFNGRASDINMTEAIDNHRIYSTFAKILYLMNVEEISDKKELKAYVIENLDEIMKCLKSSIDTSTMVKLLINVRAIENKIDPDKYPYDLKQCIRGAIHSDFNHDEDAIDLSPSSTFKSILFPGYQRTKEEYVDDWRYMVLTTSEEAVANANELVKDPESISLELYKKSK